MDSLTSFSLSLDGDDSGSAGGVQGEDVGEVVAGADDRPDDGDALQDRVEDRQGKCPGGQNDGCRPG
jgi:hypothetical protein